MEKYYVWLLLALGEGAAEISELMGRFGTAEKVYEAFRENVALVGPELTARAEKTELRSAEKAVEHLHTMGAHIITWESASYPAHLRKVHEPPCVLFAYGDMSLLQKRIITVVGSRAITPYTSETIPHIIERMDRKYAIAGTLSEGCDQLTCLNALRYGVPFIEILPCGLTQTYPSGSKTLRRFLQSNGGLLLTEYLPKTKAGQGTFLRRSRILGGISYVTLVLQAGDKSGALLTAEHSFAPLFVPPNDIFRAEYAGAVSAVRKGAKLYLNEKSIEKAFAYAEEKEAELGSAQAEKQHYRKLKRPDSRPEKETAPAEQKPVSEPAAEQETPPRSSSGAPGRDGFDTDEEYALYKVIADANAPMSPEILAERSGISPDSLAEALLDLEISGHVKSSGNRYFIP